MRRLFYNHGMSLAFCGVFIICGFFMADDLPAQPPLPGPPAVPAGGDIAEAVAIGAITAYGLWKIWKRQ